MSVGLAPAAPLRSLSTMALDGQQQVCVVSIGLVTCILAHRIALQLLSAHLAEADPAVFDIIQNVRLHRRLPWLLC